MPTNWTQTWVSFCLVSLVSFVVFFPNGSFVFHDVGREIMRSCRGFAWPQHSLPWKHTLTCLRTHTRTHTQPQTVARPVPCLAIYFSSVFSFLSVCLCTGLSASHVSAACWLAGCRCPANRFIGCLPPELWQPAQREAECWLRLSVPRPGLSWLYISFVCFTSPGGKTRQRGCYHCIYLDFCMSGEM